ncbi:GAF domain-containing protein [Shewanella sp. 1CM18E]|uniref:GAF domain-containing protein n=1 Tax=Shewanella sp. 1CM18E TaxID=2929169 RepID=UPI0020BE4D6D|nr:GAF domain-containing protein [Shewanella sp. 1CM18E]MCK8043691.1 GAF domain-containing protein [Shewanella sp. 1CM18E]
MPESKTHTVLSSINSTYRIVQSAASFWNALILPILIAVFVTYLLGVKDFSSLKPINWVLIIISGLVVVSVHIVVSIIMVRSSATDTLLPEYTQTLKQLKEIENEFEKLDKQYKIDSQTFKSQSHAMKVTSEALSYAIGSIRNKEAMQQTVTDDAMDEMISSLLWPIVVLREQLFDLRQGALWSIALYVPNSDGTLVPKWRMNDNRIPVQNRPWAPGFGVVGLSYLHKKVKYFSGDMEDQSFSVTKQSDIESYKSIIAIPIIPCEDKSSDEEHRPVGVLVLTSDRVKQFNLDRDAMFLQTHANLVAILIEKYRTYSEHSTNPDVQSTSSLDNEEGVTHES